MFTSMAFAALENWLGQPDRRHESETHDRGKIRRQTILEVVVELFRQPSSRVAKFGHVFVILWCLNKLFSNRKIWSRQSTQSPCFFQFFRVMGVDNALRHQLHQPDSREDGADTLITGDVLQTLQNPFKVTFLNWVMLHVS